MKRDDWNRLVEEARAIDMLELAASYGATLRREGAEHVGPCPICGGDDRFAINVTKQKFICRGCVRGGSGAIDLQIFLAGGDFVAAVKTLTGTESLAGTKRIAPADAKAKADQRRRDQAKHEAEQHRKASWLWSQSAPIAGTIAEHYLREARGISGTLPATLRFLPARDEYPAALIAPFGIFDEIEPGILVVPRTVCAVHLTKLLPDGSDRRHDKDADGKEKGNKIAIGAHRGQPIVLAPANDLLGLAITEGIEDALTAHRATGLGAWASASAPHMPALAATVPGYVEAVTIFGHDDAGRQYAEQLTARLRAKGIEVRLEVSS
jgi:Toprim domain-containing protein/CHC2-type zinc finger protein